METHTDCHKIQQDINRLQKYCIDSQLFLNPSKCHSISFTKKVNKIIYTYRINSTDLGQVSEVRDLGVTLDTKWSFKFHIERIINDSNKMVGFINRNARDFSDPKMLISLYYAFIHSRISFASVIWNPRYAVHINRIERIQNKFLKFLAFKTNTLIVDKDYHPIKSRFKILSLESGRTVTDLCTLHKILNSQIDSPYLLSQLNLCVPARNLRNTNLFHIPYSRTNTGQHSPLLRIQSLYNTLNSNLNLDIFSTSLMQFKRHIKASFL